MLEQQKGIATKVYPQLSLHARPTTSAPTRCTCSRPTAPPGEHKTLATFASGF